MSQQRSSKHFEAHMQFRLQSAPSMKGSLIATSSTSSLSEMILERQEKNVSVSHICDSLHRACIACKEEQDGHADI